jgi:hypothetical protein
MYDDDTSEATQFDPTPWGSRQRVLPRRTFKAVASVVAHAPVAAPSLVARVAQSAADEVPTFGPPLVREADIPTWRVPKLELYPTMPRRRIDLRMWLPIGGLVSIVIIALLGARIGGDIGADATSISAALLGETSDGRFHIVTNVEDPPAAPAVEAPAVHPPIAIAKAKHASVRVSHGSKRPQLAVDVSTPLGDLANKRRR